MPAVDGTQDDAERIALDEQQRAEVHPVTEQMRKDRAAQERHANQARVHQEAHEPTGDWIELADDPDAASVVTADPAEDPIISSLRQGAYDRGFTAGHAIGRAEGEAQAIDGQLMATSGPSDYEVWRDALLIASPIFAGGGDAQEVLKISRHVIRPSLRNCGDIGADGETCPDCQGENGNHFTGCAVNG